MGKKKKKTTKQQQHQPSSDPNDERGRNEIEDPSLLFRRTPLARAVRRGDAAAVAALLQAGLSETIAIQPDTVSIEQSVGESFTGGRSTPVHRVRCQCLRRKKTTKATKTERTTTETETVMVERRFVIKLIVLPDADAADGDQQQRQRILHKRFSYGVERRFYDGPARWLTSTTTSSSSLNIPRLLHSDTLAAETHPPVTCLALTDVSAVRHPLHPDVLNRKQAADALNFLAVWHARFWKYHRNSNKTNNNQNNNLPPFRTDSVWTRGGFWTPKPEDDGGGAGAGAAQPSSSSSSGSSSNNNSSKSNNKIATQWLQTVQYVEKTKSRTGDTIDKTLGTRLQAVAGALTQVLSQQVAVYGTLLHGDFKAANLFFRSPPEEESPSDRHDNNNHNHCYQGDADRVAAVDFQYAGWGLPPEDVAYLLYPDARGYYLSNDNDNNDGSNSVVESRLLRTYHDRLLEQLAVQGKGGPSSYPWRVFGNHYRLVQLDLTRHFLSQGWVASTDAEVQLIGELAKTLHAIDGGVVLSGGRDEYRRALQDYIENHGND